MEAISPASQEDKSEHFEDIESSADQQISTDSSLVSGQSAAQDPKPPAISGAVISAGVTSQSGLGVLATATLSGSTAASEPVAAAGLGGADSTVAMSGLQHQGSRGGPAGGGALPPGASHSLQHLNKLASEQQQTLAGTLGHGLNYHPSSPVVIQPNTAVTGGDSKPNSDLAGGINGPLTPQSSNTGTPTQGPGANTTTNPSQPQQNGQTPQPQPQSQQQDLQNNNTVKVKTCAGCGARILDRFLLHAMERYWHTGCLKCSCCQAQLGEIGTTCYAKAGMILCKNDYIRLFGSSGTCSACGQSIPASEFVMRAQTNVYHLNCFTCVACNSRLVPGDRYSLFNGSLICEHDYPKVLKGHTQIPLRPSHKVC